MEFTEKLEAYRLISLAMEILDTRNFSKFLFNSLFASFSDFYSKKADEWMQEELNRLLENQDQEDTHVA